LAEIHPLLPDLFLRQLESRDTEGVQRSIDNAGELGDGARHLLRGMRRFSAYHRAHPGEPHASVVVDAIADLVPAHEDRYPAPLFQAAASYLMGLPSTAPRIELFELPPTTAAVDVVPVASLEDALAEGDLEETCRTAARLVRVIRTREYFLELLLDVVAPERTPEGHLFVHANATVKSLHDMEWEMGRGLAYRLIEALSEQPLEPAPGIWKTPPAVPCRAAYLAALDLDVPETIWLYLAHAFQAERYAQVRSKGVRAGLRSWIASRLFEGDEVRMQAAEEALGPRDEHGPRDLAPRLDESEGAEIATSIRAANPEAVDRVSGKAASGADIETLYRWIGEAAIPFLENGDPRPILAVNGARWGAHLLDPQGAGRLTARLIERMIAFARGDS
jgi:hypothetical protein